MISMAAHAVDFRQDIQPLLKNKCSRCHSGHEAKGGLSLNKREDILKGGENGAAAVPGKAAMSLILQRVTASDPDERMPSKGNPLSAKEIALLRAWVNEGLAWPKGFHLAEWRRAPLAPRVVKLPGGRGNPIDRLLADYFPASPAIGR